MGKNTFKSWKENTGEGKGGWDASRGGKKAWSNWSIEHRNKAKKETYHLVAA